MSAEDTTAIVCTQCGARWTSDARFCGGCGHMLAAKPVGMNFLLTGRVCSCPPDLLAKRKVVSVDGANYCTYCRKERTAAMDSAPSPAAPQSKAHASGAAATAEQIATASPSERNTRRAQASAPGWYPNPNDRSTQRYWNGQEWTEHTAPTAPRVTVTQLGGPNRTVALYQPKSEGVALVLEFIFPGAGLAYIGLSKEATPFLIASAVAFLLTLTGILAIFGIAIWLVCLVITMPKIGGQTREVNAEALRSVNDC